jgi:hypothetical protein
VLHAFDKEAQFTTDCHKLVDDNTRCAFAPTSMSFRVMCPMHPTPLYPTLSNQPDHTECDLMTRVYFAFYYVGRWFGLRLDVVTTVRLIRLRLTPSFTIVCILFPR